MSGMKSNKKNSEIFLDVSKVKKNKDKKLDDKNNFELFADDERFNEIFEDDDYNIDTDNDAYKTSDVNEKIVKKKKNFKKKDKNSK